MNWMIYLRHCVCQVCNVGMPCQGNEECGTDGVCKVDPDSECAKAQAAGFMIGCNHLR